MSMLSPAKSTRAQQPVVSTVVTRTQSKQLSVSPPQSTRKPPLTASSKSDYSPTQQLRVLTNKMSLDSHANDENQSMNKQPTVLASPNAKKSHSSITTTNTHVTPILSRTRSKQDTTTSIATAITSASPSTRKQLSTPIHQPSAYSSSINSSPIASASPTAKRVISKLSHQSSNKQSSNVVEPPTPSKIIFSPQYHDDHANANERHALKNKQITIIKPALKPVKTSEETGDDEFDPFLFIKHLPLLAQYQTHGRIVLPPKTSQHKITLALDLDETLVHCSVQPIDVYDFTFTVNFNGIDYTVYVRVRPYLTEFLQSVSEWFETIIFTASQKVYADKLLNILDPKHQYINHRIFRDSCTVVEGNYLKDLSVLGRSMNSMCLIDNSIQAFAFQLDNGIPIESWFDDVNDCELLNMIPFLEQIRYCNDVRPYIRSTFKLQEYVDSL